MSATIQANNPDVQWMPNSCGWTFDGWINAIAGVPFQASEIWSDTFEEKCVQKDNKFEITIETGEVGPKFNYLLPRPPSQATAEQAKCWAHHIRLVYLSSKLSDLRLHKLIHFADGLIADDLKNINNLKSYIGEYVTFLESCEGYQEI